MTNLLMRFVLIILLTGEIKGCKISLDFSGFEENILKPELRKVVRKIEKIEEIENIEILRIEKLFSRLKSLQTKIEKLITAGTSLSKSTSKDDELRMMSKADCTKVIVGNRKVACDDLEQIGSCRCKDGTEYSMNDEFKKNCKIDYCICLNSSKVNLFGLHRRLLNCVVI